MVRSRGICWLWCESTGRWLSLWFGCGENILRNEQHWNNLSGAPTGKHFIISFIFSQISILLRWWKDTSGISMKRVSTCFYFPNYETSRSSLRTIFVPLPFMMQCHINFDIKHLNFAVIITCHPSSEIENLIKMYLVYCCLKRAPKSVELSDRALDF